MARFKEADASKMVGAWLSEYLPNVRMLSSRTIDSYEEAMVLFHKYLKETGGSASDPKLMKDGIFAAKVGHFNASNVAGFIEWLHTARGNCSKTIEQRLAAIRSFLRYAALKSLRYAALLAQAEGIRIGRKDPEKLVGSMSMEAWDAVVSQPVLPKRTEWRNWVFMVVMYEVAGRNQEIIGLRVCDVALGGEDPRIYVWGKGNKEGVTPIRESVAEILRDYIARFHPGREKSEDPLFYIMRGGAKCRMSPDCSEAFLKRYGEAARRVCPAVPDRVHPHLLRHTRAQHLKDEGMTDEELAVFLRHSNTDHVKVYAQASAKRKRLAIEKANGRDPENKSRRGFWEGDEDAIGRLRNPGGGSLAKSR